MTNELYHHGILGQKWGVRRYQNKDGTLTTAGKKRLGLSEKQKKAIKTAVTVGAIAAGAALASYGAYKINQKTTQALIDSYSNVGRMFEARAYNANIIAFNKLVDADIERAKGSLEERILRDSSDYHFNIGLANQRIADDLNQKALSKKFGAKERLSSAVEMIATGPKLFKSSKQQRIFNAAESRFQREKPR